MSIGEGIDGFINVREWKTSTEFPALNCHLFIPCVSTATKEAYVRRVVMIAIFVHTLSFQAQCPAH